MAEALPEGIVPRLMGYVGALTRSPGEVVQLRAASADIPRRATATLVRLVSGSSDPAGCGLIEREVAPPVAFPAEPRPTGIGSCATLPLDGWAGPAVSAACLFRTDLPASGADQVLIGTRGWSAGLDGAGRPFAALGASCAVGDAPVPPRRWLRLLAVLDAGTDEASVVVETVGPGMPFRSAGSAATEAGAMLTAEGALLAARPGPGGREAHFTGKLERPRLVAGRVAEGDWAGLLAHDPALPAGLAWIGAWDLSRGMGGRDVHDVSGAERHGTLHQLPMRAVTGADWDGSAFAPNEVPRHYAAVAFHADDLYDAGWPVSAEVALPADLPSGVHALRLEDGGAPTRVLFFVRRAAAAAPARVAFLAATAHFLAYANYRLIGRRAAGEALRGRLWSFGPEDVLIERTPGIGASTYDRHPDGSGIAYSSPHRPILNLQPDTRLSSFSGDMFVLAWLDHLGVPVDIVTDEDLHRDGTTALAGARVVLTGGHPEYYSAEMLDALEEHLSGGGRLMYLGGNGFYWRIAHSPHWPGAIEVRRPEGGTRAWDSAPGEACMAFDGGPGGLWQRLGRPPNRLAGVGFAAQGFDRAAPYRRLPAADDPRARFLFAGVGGDVIGDHGVGYWGAAGQEVDRYDPLLGSPPHALVVASSAGLHTDNMLLTPEELLSTHLALGGTENPLVRADLVFFETPAGGAVLSTGSICWPCALPTNGFDNDVARITGNALRAFLSDHRFAPDDPYEAPP